MWKGWSKRTQCKVIITLLHEDGPGLGTAVLSLLAVVVIVNVSSSDEGFLPAWAFVCG